MATDTTSVLEAATRFHSWDFNVVACGGQDKAGKTYFKRPSPDNRWKDSQGEARSFETMKGQPWEEANGLALVNGVGRIRAVDFDAVKNEDGSKVDVPFQVVESFCQVLGIEANSYEWIVKTGNGWHVWFLADDMNKKQVDGIEDRDLTKADFKPNDSNKGLFDHIELRWKNHFTVVPPSQHSEEKWYHFKNCDFPSSLPVEVNGDQVAAAVRSICNTSEKQRDSGHQRPESKPGKQSKQRASPGWTVDKVRSALAVIPAHNEHIEWKKIVAAVVDAIGAEQAEAVLAEWSPIPSGERQYKDVIKDGLQRVTAGTLVMIAREHGWSEGEDLTLAESVQAFLLESFEFQFNVVKRQLEYRAKDSDSWNLADDKTFEQWAVTFEKKRLHKKGVSPDKVRLYSQDEAICRNYDPIKDFFDGLPAWDGSDHIEHYASAATLKEESNRSTFILHLKKWLVGTYSCGYFGGKGGAKNELFFILQGKQGDGKTFFLRRLTEGELERYRCENYDATKKEDVYAILSKSFICIDEELESLSRKEASSLKRLLSSEFFEFRSAYARAEVNHIRRVSFCGSVNDQTFLKDQTGNRRFLVHAVNGIDLERLNSVDMRQVWAQVKHLHEEGFRHWLNKEEQKVLNVTNSEFEVVDTLEEILLRYVRPATSNEQHEALQTMEVLEYITKKHDDENTEGRSSSYEQTPMSYRNAVTRLRVDNATANRLGNLLSKNGFAKKSVKRNGESRHCWLVVKKTADTNRAWSNPEGGEGEDAPF